MIEPRPYELTPPRLFGPLAWLLDRGVHLDASAAERKRVRLTNEVGLMIAVLVVPYAGFFLFIDRPGGAIVDAVAWLTMVIALQLNAVGWFRSARVVLVLGGHILVFGIAWLLGPGAGVDRYAYATIIAPLFIHQQRERAEIAGYSLLTVTCMVVLQAWSFNHAPLMPLPPAIEPWFFLSSQIGGLLTAFIFALYFYRESNLVEQSLLRDNSQMRQLAETDALTGVANRRTLEQALEIAWSRAVANGQSVALIMADLDHFKEYNDTFGHPTGDRALIAVSTAFTLSLKRGQDVVGRFGGEEFLIVLPETQGPGAVAVAERARAAVLSLQINHPGNTGLGTISCSFGVASMRPTRGDTPTELLRRADAALYAAKRKGRNRVASWTDIEAV